VRPLALVCALGAIFFWSTNAVVAKYALASLTVAQVQTLQFAGASLAVFLIGRYVRREGFIWRDSRALALGVVGLVGTMVFQYIAFAAGPIATVNLIAYSWPLLTAVAVAASTAAYRSARLVLTSLAGFLGVAMLIGGDGFALTGGQSLVGYVAAIVSALCMAAYTVGVGRLAIAPASLLLPACLIGLGGTSAWWIVSGAGVPDVLPIAMGLYLGIFPMGVGYLLWSYANRLGAAGSISTLGYSTPVVSTALLVVSGESLTTVAILGGLIIVVCSALAGSGKLERETDVKPA